MTQSHGPGPRWALVWAASMTLTLMDPWRGRYGVLYWFSCNSVCLAPSSSQCQDVNKPYHDDLEGSSTSDGGRNDNFYTPSKPEAPAKKSSQPSKLVDLGAAATFASQAAEEKKKELATTNQASSSAIDSVFGDFSSHGNSSQAPPPAGSQGWRTTEGGPSL